MKRCVLFLSVLLPVEAAHSQQEDTLERAIATICAAATFDDDAIGIAGTKSETYRAYEVLRSKADATRLNKLRSDKSAVLRCYAVQALVEAHPATDLLAVALGSLDDTTVLETFRGCIRAKQQAGDVMLDLVRPRLTHSQQLALAERLMASRSPLDARARALRSTMFPARLAQGLRKLAKAGDDAALVGLARFRDQADAALILARLSDRKRRVRDLVDAFRAAELHGHKSLLKALLAREADARSTLASDNAVRLRFWIRAIAAQRSPKAARFLESFVFGVKTTGGKADQLRKTLREAVRKHDAPAYALLLDRLAKTAKREKGKD